MAATAGLQFVGRLSIAIVPRHAPPLSSGTSRVLAAAGLAKRAASWCFAPRSPSVLKSQLNLLYLIGLAWWTGAMDLSPPEVRPCFAALQPASLLSRILPIRSAWPCLALPAPRLASSMPLPARPPAHISFGSWPPSPRALLSLPSEFVSRSPTWETGRCSKQTCRASLEIPLASRCHRSVPLCAIPHFGPLLTYAFCTIFPSSSDVGTVSSSLILASILPVISTDTRVHHCTPTGHHFTTSLRAGFFILSGQRLAERDLSLCRAP